MAAVALVVRSLLRRRALATVALVLLVGVASGAVLTAATGARRTSTAFDRFLDDTHASDVVIVGTGDLTAADLEQLPSVERAADAIGTGMAVDGADGLPDMERGPGASASVDGTARFESDRPMVIEGHLPRPDRADEILINQAAADEYDLGPGDRMRFYAVDLNALDELFSAIPENREPTEDEMAAYLDLMEPVELRVVGLARLASEIVGNENQTGPIVSLTPAFAEAHIDHPSYRFSYVDLVDREEADGQFRAELARAHPDEPIQVQTRATMAASVEQAVGPYAQALTIFSIVAGLTALLVVGQALARQVMADAEDDPTLSGLGASRIQVVMTSAGRSLLAVLVGVVIGIIASVALSPLFPIGPARRAEPSPGVRIDAPLLVGLAAAIVVVLIARVLVTAWLQAFRAGASSRNTEPRPARRLTHPPLPPVATVGVRMAFRPRDATVRSARTSTVVGVTVALATALAALTFAASLDRLITRPESYGWTWDSLLETYENGLAPATRRDLERDEHVEAFTIGARSPLIVDGDSVSGIGFDPVRGDLLPTITEGRFPAGPGEIALGPATLRRLDRSIGDEVTITDASGGIHQLHVVGRTVIPSLNLDDVYGLADGAAMTLEGLQAISTGAEPAFALVDFAVDAGRDAIAAANDRYGESGTFLGVQQPGEIISFDGVRRTPLMLAGLLALLGLGVLVHGLLTTVRGGRHVFAVLKTIGFSRRQVRATIGWQVNAMVILSAVLAVPVGVAGGRLAWSLLAGRLGLTDEPVLPLLAVFLLLLATVVVANVVAIGPSHMAARTRPARLLRAE